MPIKLDVAIKEAKKQYIVTRVIEKVILYHLLLLKTHHLFYIMV